MKSAMVSRQGSMSRLQGPRSLGTAEDGSPRRRAAKSVKFDKTDEVIQYVAATPEITEETWDQISLESCDSDLDNRPLPSLPPFVLTPEITTTREQRLMQLPGYKTKLGAPLGETDEDFDFGAQSPSPPSSPSPPGDKLPSPLQPEEESPIIDRPSLDERMDAIMESRSGMSPSMTSSGHSWHRRTDSQMSDFSDMGSESNFPVRQISLPEDTEEPAQWRDNSELARQDSLQEDQRQLPTQQIGPPQSDSTASPTRSHSKRKRQIMEMLDPHKAAKQHADFDTIPEEEEEEEEQTGDRSIGISHEPAALYADRSFAADPHEEEEHFGDRSIGISHEPAALYADRSFAANPHEEEEEEEHPFGQEHHSNSLNFNLLDSVSEYSERADSERAETSEHSDMRDTSRETSVPDDSFELSLPPRLGDSASANSSYEDTSRITYYDSEDLDNMADTSEIARPKMEEPTLEEPKLEEPTLEEPKLEAQSLEDHKPVEPKQDEQNLEEQEPDTHSSYEEQEEEVQPKNKMYPGILPWNPAFDTTADNLAAMPTPEIPARSPERNRRSWVLEKEASQRNLLTSASQRDLNDLHMGEWVDDDDDESENEEALEQQQPEELSRVNTTESFETSAEQLENSIGELSFEGMSEKLEVPQARAEHTVEQFTEQPANYSDEHSDEHSDEQVAEQVAERSSSSEQSDEHSDEHSADLIVEQPAAQGSEHPVEHSVERSAPSIELTVNDITIPAEGYDSNALRYITENDSVGELNDHSFSPQQQFAGQRKGSTSSLRDKHSFVPTGVPSLSPIRISSSPFITFDEEPSRVEQIDAVVASSPSPRNYGHSKMPSISPSMATTDNGDYSILKEMSLDTEPLAGLEQKNWVEKDMSYNDRLLTQPELDSDLSDFENQQEAEPEPVQEPEQQEPEQLEPEPQVVLQMDEMLVKPSLSDGDVSISEPSFGEKASTMLSLFSEQFAPSEAELDRVSSRQSYVLRESGSYVIATSPKRHRQRRSSAYEVLGEEESEYALPQTAIERSRALPQPVWNSGAAPAAVAAGGIPSATSSSYNIRSSTSSTSTQASSLATARHAMAPSRMLAEIPESASSRVLPARTSSASNMRNAQPAQPPMAKPVQPVTQLKTRSSEPSSQPSSNYSSFVAQPVRSVSKPRLIEIQPAQDAHTVTVQRAQRAQDTQDAQVTQDAHTRGAQAAQAAQFAPKSSAPGAQIAQDAHTLPTQDAQPKQVASAPVAQDAQAMKFAPAQVTQDAQAKQIDHTVKDDDQLPVGLLYIAVNAVSVGNLPAETYATLQIDNGVHCIYSKSLPVSQLSHFDSEYRVGFMEKLPVTAVLRLSTRQPKSLEHLHLGSDGSFASFDLLPLKKSAYGKCQDVTLDGRNIWSNGNSVTASMTCKAVYIPCISSRDSLPHSINGVLSRLSMARKEISGQKPRATGVLRQYGGDLKKKVGKQRYVILDPIAPLLVVHSIRTRRPRALINIAKASSVIAVGNTMLELHFKNRRDSLAFEFASPQDMSKWSAQLQNVIGQSRGARPKWIDAILYETK